MRRIDETQAWRPGRGVLQEIASEISDRLPDSGSRLQLRLDLPHRAFDDLAAKIEALRGRRGEAHVWLSVGFDAPTFPLPESRNMVDGRVQSSAFLRELDVTRQHFELGLVEGFFQSSPPRYTRVLGWATTQTRR